MKSLICGKVLKQAHIWDTLSKSKKETIIIFIYSRISSNFSVDFDLFKDYPIFNFNWQTQGQKFVFLIDQLSLETIPKK